MTALISAALSLYAVYLIVYETIPSVQPAASDPRSPFAFPFSVRNNSKLFPVASTEFTCRILSMLDSAGNRIENNDFMQRQNAEIRKGQQINYRCGVRTDARITRLSVEVRLTYETDLYLFPWKREIDPRIFTWIADAGAPQWIEGVVR